MKPKITRRRKQLELCAWATIAWSCSLILIFSAQAQEESGEAGGGDSTITSAANPDPSVEQRLALLTPADPQAYFLLAEDVADLGDRALATTLFVLAAHLDDERFGRSACLALADLARRANDSDEQDRLTAMARMYPVPAASEGPALTERDVSGRQEAAAMASAALGFYRQGDGQRAYRTLSRQDDALDLLRRYGHSLGSIAGILAWCESNPRCDMCKNERVIKCPSCHGGADPGLCSLCQGDHFLVCRTCEGDPGPDLTPTELDTMLQFEIGLLAGRGATWSAQFQLDGGRERPLFDPSQLAASLGVDVTQTAFRDGEWQRPESEETDPYSP